MATRSVLHVDGYIRVSRVHDRRGPRFISPDVQREQIASWAQARDAVVLQVFQELDESGARADRPLLREAITRIESGISDGLVASKVDRFGRSPIDGFLMIDRVRAAGGRFYSVQDGLDTGTEAGRLVLRIMLSVAEFYLEGVRSDWRIAKARAVKRGVYIGPNTPVGYRKTRSGRLKLDPRTAPIIAEVYRRRAAGETGPSLCRFLESEGVRTARGNPGWSATSFYRVLEQRVYLGELHHADAVNLHAHPPIIDPATWARALRPRQITRRTHAAPTLLGGLVRCASCRMMLSAARRPDRSDPSRKYLMYQCRTYYATGSCPSSAFVMSPGLDDYVTAAFFTLLGRRRRPPLAELGARERDLVDVNAKLVRYRDDDTLRSLLGDDQFRAGVATRIERVRAARVALAEVQARADTHALPRLREMRREWPSLEVVERRALIAQVIDCVFVAKGHGQLERRVTVCPIGTAPTGLPRQGDKGAPLRAIQPRRGWLNPSTLVSRP